MIDLGNYFDEYVLMGSAAYELPDYTPKDYDICVCGGDDILDKNGYLMKSVYNKFTDSINLLRKVFDTIPFLVDLYHLPFDWGGVTFLRATVGDYDIFLTDRITFETIKGATALMRDQPDSVKLLISDNKIKRVELFRLFAKMIQNEMYDKQSHKAK